MEEQDELWKEREERKVEERRDSSGIKEDKEEEKVNKNTSLRKRGMCAHGDMLFSIH